MNPQDNVMLPLIAALVVIIVGGLVLFELLRIVRSKIQSDTAVRDQLKKQIDQGNLVVSHRYDPAGDALKYSASAYIIVITLLMVWTCCLLPILSMIVTVITGRSIAEMIQGL